MKHTELEHHVAQPLLRGERNGFNISVNWHRREQIWGERSQSDSDRSEYPKKFDARCVSMCLVRMVDYGMTHVVHTTLIEARVHVAVAIPCVALGGKLREGCKETKGRIEMMTRTSKSARPRKQRLI